MERKNTKTIHLGTVPIGGGHPISVQSMTNTPTANVKATVSQIRKLQKAGCEIIRVAVPDQDAANVLGKIRAQIHIPLVADIHFDHKLALTAIQQRIDGLRLNPGNIGSEVKVREVVEHARERMIPIRIGVNSGSLSREMLSKYGHTAEALVESALEHVAILERMGYEAIKISVKASSVEMTVDSYRLLSSKVSYPLHIGITEAGTDFSGTIKSAMGIGALLLDGIGDTIRVSLTSDPVNEVKTGIEILKSLNLRKGLKIVSCPTCGRTRINLINLTKQVEKALLPYHDINITVAVMGCVVNGPGEAREADYGIAGGDEEGILFRKGEIVAKLPERELLEALIDMIRTENPIL
ncbi:MAG TPA: flavodoxin-dependent (E)-4-hydroxy-3-methylbut-2-enyl-diphosphate synthase [Candidatus Cloacimonadota bacterium]|nr:flavodoxin-dependent (E)-4-hydroxy-3-methylbut-2-enyl-diphosphate synthase [Candidatus Cloacimonadota bacterium]